MRENNLVEQLFELDRFRADSFDTKIRQKRYIPELKI